MKKFLTFTLVFLLLLAPIHTVQAATCNTAAVTCFKSIISLVPIDCIKLGSNSNCGLLTLFINNNGQVCNVKGSSNFCANNTEQLYKVKRLSTLVCRIYKKSITRIKPTPVPIPTPEATPVPTPTPEPTPVPTPTPEPTPAPSTSDFNAMQTEMLGYINAARAEAGVEPLVLDKALCDGAYLKSQDMAENGYFDHNSPTYGSPFTMMKNLGITYRMAGENIAKNISVIGAHEAFMNSPGHKANILNSGYNKVGLGFYQSGRYLYVTQWFTN